MARLGAGPFHSLPPLKARSGVRGNLWGVNGFLLGEALTPGPHACSKRITFQHAFELAKKPTRKKPQGVKRSKALKGKFKKTKVLQNTNKEQMEAIREQDRADTQVLERKEANRLRMRILRRSRTKAGLCKDCGKTASILGQVRCETCRDKHRADLRRRKAGTPS